MGIHLCKSMDSGRRYIVGLKACLCFVQLLFILVEMGCSYGHYVNFPEQNSDRH